VRAETVVSAVASADMLSSIVDQLNELELAQAAPEASAS
jgi:hypothetical protein